MNFHNFGLPGFTETVNHIKLGRISPLYGVEHIYRVIGACIIRQYPLLGSPGGYPPIAVEHEIGLIFARQHFQCLTTCAK